MSTLGAKFFSGIYTVIVGLLVASSLLQACSAFAQSAPSSGFVILVDVSQSFLPTVDDEKRAFRTSLSHVADAVARTTVQEWDQPVLLFWSTIGAFSLDAPLICGDAVQYRTRIQLDKKKTRKELQSANELQAWLKACQEKFAGTGVKAEPYTDIAGGIRHASTVMQRIKGRKAVIVVSDFVESLPPGRVPVNLRLSGERIVMLYRPELSDVKDPNQMFTRLERWADRFKQAGALAVCQVPLKGLLPSTIASCLE